MHTSGKRWAIALGACVVLVGALLLIRSPERDEKPNADRCVETSARVGEVAWKQAEEKLDEARQAMRKMNQDLGIDAEKAAAVRKMLGAVVDPESDVTDEADPMGIFGVATFEKRLAKGKAVAEKLVVTERDLRALEYYVEGRFDFALLMFEGEARPLAPFASFIRGCALFELNRFQEAGDSFRAVYDAVPQSTAALLLANICTHLKQGARPSPALLMETYDLGYFDTERQVQPQRAPGLLAGFMSIVSQDPLLLCVATHGTGILLKAQKRILEEYKASTDPMRKITLALLLEKSLARLLIHQAAVDHPQCAFAQVMALLFKDYEALPDSDIPPAEVRARDIATLQKLEPRNGAFVLLSIPVWDTVADLENPLTDDEMTILLRAAVAPEFHTYHEYGATAVGEEALKRFGGLGGVFASVRPLTSDHIFCVRWRTEARLQREWDAGDDTAANKTLSVLEALIRRLDEDPGHGVKVLRVLSARLSLTRKMQAHATEANRADLLEKALKHREHAVRRQALLMLSAGRCGACAQLPLPAFRRLDLAFEFGMTEEAGLIAARARRMLRLYGDELKAEALSNLEKQVDHEFRYGADRDIIMLERLRAREALPILRRYAESDDPFEARLARRAIERILGNEEPRLP